MEKKKGLYQINHEIEQLMREKEEVTNTLIKNKIEEVSQLIYSENTQSPLSIRELQNILKTFYQDLKDIID